MIFSLLYILVDRPMRGGGLNPHPPPLAYALDSYRSIHDIPRYCKFRQYQVEANVDTFDALICKLFSVL